MTVLDDSVVVLHGSVDNSLRWMWLSKKHGTVVIARVSASGFYMREPEAPGVAEISAQLPRLWSYHSAGVNLAGHATHHLAPPHMQAIVPIPVTPVDQFKTEAMF